MNIKQQAWILVSMCFLCLAFAQANDQNSIRVGYIDVTDMILDENSIDKKGYGLEIFQTIEHYSDLKFEYVEVPYLNVISAIQSGEIDILGPIGYEPERAEIFSFTEETFVDAEIILVSDQNTEAFYNDPKSIDGKTVMVFDGNPYNSYLERYLEEHDISVEYVIADEYNDFLNHSADFYLATSSSSGRDFVKDFKVIAKLGNIDLRFMAPSQNKGILDEMDRALKKVKDSEHGFYDRIYEEYFDYFESFGYALTKEQALFLKDKNFTVGYASNHQPYQYTGQDGTAQGINVQILNALAEKHNFTVQYVPIDNVATIDDSFPKYDIILSMTGSLSEYNKFYNYTEAYTQHPIVLFTKKHLNEKIADFQNDVTFGIIQYNVFNYDLLYSTFQGASLKTYSDLESLLRAFRNDAIDGMFLTSNGSDYALASLGSQDYSLYVTSVRLPFRLFISKALPTSYLSIFNIMSRDISSQAIEEISLHERTLFIPRLDFLDIVVDNLPIAIGICGTIILLIALYYFYTQKRNYEAILAIVNFDAITGLHTLYMFQKHMKDVLKTAHAGEYEVVSIDIDYFKNINKTFGREAGNKVLATLAKMLTVKLGAKMTLKQNTIRTAPCPIEGSIRENTLLGRDSADRILVFQKRESDIDLKDIWRHSIKPVLASIIGENYPVHLSVGRYLIETPHEPCDLMIDNANRARVLGKGVLKSTFIEYTPKEKKSQEVTTEILFKMEGALRNREFTVFFQPKVHLEDLTIKGAEALVRWNPMGENPIYPDAFIPLFEATGFIFELDCYVFEEVCRFISENRGFMNVPIISVNLSGHTVLYSKTVRRLIDILAKHKVSPREIELEVTESAILNQEDILAAKITLFHSLGFSVSLDDFGAGASSLNRLASLSVDVLKMDKAFLDCGFNCQKKFALVKAVINMAKDLNLKLVAEGVETKEQAYTLQNMGCDFIQGYYFSRPLTENDFIALLLKNTPYPSLEENVESFALR